MIPGGRAEISDLTWPWVHVTLVDIRRGARQRAAIQFAADRARRFGA